MLRIFAASLALAFSLMPSLAATSAKGDKALSDIDIEFKCNNQELTIKHATDDYINSSFACDSEGYVTITHK